MYIKQMDCFKTNLAYWKFLGIWPGENRPSFYEYYSKIFIISFVMIYILLLALNLYFMPNRLVVIIDELIFFFTELTVFSKVITFIVMRDKINRILNTLQCDNFQPDAGDATKILKKAKKFFNIYYITVAVISYLSNLTHLLSPLLAHVFLPISLKLPVCSYSFLNENIKEMFIYPIYLYQSLGMHFHMLINVNTDSFILGLMILSIAQLEVLHYNLEHLADYETTELLSEKERVFKRKLQKCICHFVEIEKLCDLVEEVFSVCLFVQFSASSCIICVVLFRFTLPAPTSYYVFLSTYMGAMLVQILMPTWFGTRITQASSSLSQAIYNCDWISRPQEFKGSMMIFVERMSRPLNITAWKMFPLLLTTFTKIMNTAYSFFTLLRNMQARDC